MYKRSQAAMEFLMSYGWVIFLVMICLAVLVSFGVFDTSKMLPDVADAGRAVAVKDFTINENSVSFIFDNVAGKPLYNFSINVKSCNNGAGSTSDPIRLGKDGTATVTVSCPGAGAVFSSFKSELEVSYMERMMPSSSAAVLSSSSGGGDSGIYSPVIELGSMSGEIKPGDTLFCDVLLSACGYTGWIAGFTYCLDDDINNYGGTCFSITANNVTLNGRGHTLDGDDSGTDYGISAVGRLNISVLNFGNLTDFYAGVQFSATNHSLITDINVFSNRYGIMIQNSSSNNSITDILAVSNTFGGIELNSSSRNNNLSDLIVRSNNVGGILIFFNSTSNRIEDVIADNHVLGRGIYIDMGSSYTVLSDISANYNGYGIFFYKANSSVLSDISGVSNIFGLDIGESYFMNISNITLLDSSNFDFICISSLGTYGFGNVFDTVTSCADGWPVIGDNYSDSNGCDAYIDSCADDDSGIFYEPNRQYCLTADLSDGASCLEPLYTENITIDFQGHTIICAAPGFGINAAGGVNLTVQNGTISDCAYAMQIDSFSNYHIQGMTSENGVVGYGDELYVSDSDIFGIDVDGVDDTIASAGASVYIVRSNIGSIYSNGGTSDYVAESGGEITIENSTINALITAWGGSSTNEGGAAGGTIRIINSAVPDINARGGSGFTIGGTGGNIIITGASSSTGDLNVNGGIGTGPGSTGGSGGTITLDGVCPSLENIGDLVCTGGSATTTGPDGDCSLDLSDCIVDFGCDIFIAACTDDDAPGFWQSGNTYCLQNDITNFASDCLTIGSDDVILDGNNYLLDGIGGDEIEANGIVISSQNNITVRNIRITEFQRGILLLNSDDCLMTNIFTLSSGFDGIELIYSDYNQITNSTLNSAVGSAGLNGSGLILVGSTNNLVTDIITNDNNGSGVYLITSSDNQLIDIVADNNARYGIELESSSSNMISNNTATGILDGLYCSINSSGNSGSGNLFSAVSGCSDGWPVLGEDYYDVTGCDYYIASCEVDDAHAYDQYWFSGMKYCLVADLFYDGSNGCLSFHNGVVSNLIIDGLGHSIFFNGTRSGNTKAVDSYGDGSQSFLTVRNLTVSGFDYGIFIYKGFNNIIDHVTAINNEYGMMFSVGSSNEIYDSIACGNNVYDIDCENYGSQKFENVVSTRVGSSRDLNFCGSGFSSCICDKYIASCIDDDVAGFWQNDHSYCLLNDIDCGSSNNLLIKANNTVLDGGGYSLSGTSLAGIKTVGLRNVSIKNFGQVSGFVDAVSLVYTNFSSIKNNTLSAGSFAVRMTSSLNNNVMDNNISNTQIGVYFDTCAYNNLSRNYIKNNITSFGIYMDEGTSYSLVYNNTICGAPDTDLFCGNATSHGGSGNRLTTVYGCPTVTYSACP